MENRLPFVDELEQLIVRTDFSDDAAWDAMKEALLEEDHFQRINGPSNVYVEDPIWESATPAILKLARTGPLELCFLFDSRSLESPHSLQVVDLDSDQRPLPFRVAPDVVIPVSAMINLGESDFEELCESIGEDGSLLF